MISENFINAIKLNKKRAYKIAQEAGVHPSTLSKILNGIVQVNVGDARVAAIGKVLGLKARDCFTDGRRQTT